MQRSQRESGSLHRQKDAGEIFVSVPNKLAPSRLESVTLTAGTFLLCV